MLSAIRSGVTQPLPTLLQAPSPTAGYQGTSASAGQRRAYSGRSRIEASSRSTSGGNWLGSSPRSPSSGSYQETVCWSRRPVPDAIDTLLASLPHRRSRRYSA